SDGEDFWIIDERKFPMAESLDVGALLADRAAIAKHWEDVPKAAYDPVDRLKAMDEDGIAISVLYPTVAGFSGARFAGITDAELQLACVQAYNDWLIDEWAKQNQRFIPQCLLPLAPIDAALAEIRRA